VDQKNNTTTTTIVTMVSTTSTFNSNTRSRQSSRVDEFIRQLDTVGMNDVNIVGGKNASLGEMIQNLKGCRVPGGFAITAQAYRYFLEENNLINDIHQLLDKIQLDPVTLEL
jgi:phosphoenolpyruvate synthase/pyruvate phosphate dikinase